VPRHQRREVERQVVGRAGRASSPEPERGQAAHRDTVEHFPHRVLSPSVVRAPRAQRRHVVPARDQAAREVVQVLPGRRHVGRVELVDEQDAHHGSG
jgi:hypothetical protein